MTGLRNSAKPGAQPGRAEVTAVKAPLDEAREKAGLRPAPPGPAAWPRTRRGPAREFGRRARRFVGGNAVVAAVAAITHGFFANWLADDQRQPWDLAHAIVAWPSPLAQQALAAAAAVALLVIAVATGGYQRVSRRLSWPLYAATAAASLAAWPMALVCAAVAAVLTLIAVIVLIVIVAVIAIIAAVL